MFPWGFHLCSSLKDELLRAPSLKVTFSYSLQASSLEIIYNTHFILLSYTDILTLQNPASGSHDVSYQITQPIKQCLIFQCLFPLFLVHVLIHTCRILYVPGNVSNS